MAKVQVSQVGSVTKEFNASTVAEALSSYGLEGQYTVKVNGQSASMESSLREGDFISVGEKVKGGMA